MTVQVDEVNTTTATLRLLDDDFMSAGDSIPSSAVLHEEKAEEAEEKKDDSSPAQKAEDTTPLSSSDPPKINDDLIKELNIALDSCEQMRRVNLEVEHSCAAPCLPPSMAVNHEKCTYCQREAWHQFMLNPTPRDNNGDNNSNSNVNGDGGGGINIGSLKLDGSRIKNLDGSRMRRFRSNVGSLFAAKPDDTNQDAVRKEDDDLFAKATDSMDAAPKEDSMTCGSNHSSSFEGESGNNSTKATPRKKFLQKSHPPCLTCGRKSLHVLLVLFCAQILITILFFPQIPFVQSINLLHSQRVVYVSANPAHICLNLIS